MYFQERGLKIRSEADPLGQEGSIRGLRVLFLTKMNYRYEFPSQIMASETSKGRKRLRNPLGVDPISLLRSRTYGGISHLGAGLVISELEHHGVRVHLADLDEPLSIQHAGWYDKVMISMMEISFDKVVSIVREIGEDKVILGGIGATYMEQQIRKLFPNIPIVAGPAYGLMGQVIDDIRNRSLKPKYYRETPVDFTKTDDQHIMPKSTFRRLDYFRRTLRVIEAGEGCHLACPFCLSAHDKVAYKPIEVLKTELIEIREQGGRVLFFVDQNLFSYRRGGRVDREHLLELFKMVNSLGFYWIGEGTIDDVIEDRELLQEMGKRNLGFLIGLEDISNESCSVAGPKNRLKRGLASKVRLLRGHRIPIAYSLVFGTDDQDYPNTFKSSAKMVNELGLSTLPHLVTPRVGTRLYNLLESEQRLLPVSFGEKDQKYHVAHRPKQMTPEQLMKGFVGYYNEVFSVEQIMKRIGIAALTGSVPYMVGIIGYEMDGYFTRIKLNQLYGSSPVLD